MIIMPESVTTVCTSNLIGEKRVVKNCSKSYVLKLSKPMINGDIYVYCYLL